MSRVVKSCSVPGRGSTLSEIKILFFFFNDTVFSYNVTLYMLLRVNLLSSNCISEKKGWTLWRKNAVGSFQY